MSSKERVVIVTGGASGIGRGIAEAYLETGANVVIADVEEPALIKVAEELGVMSVRVDVSRLEDIEQLAEKVLERYGRVDVLCNNAGVGSLNTFDNLTLDEFRWVMDVNGWGVVYGMKVFLPIIERTSPDGRILNTASIGALINAPGMAAYAFSKAAVLGMTEAIAGDLAARDSTVKVSVLLPARVRSNLSESMRNKPDGAVVSPLRIEHLPPGAVLEAIDVGRSVVAAVNRGDLHILTHSHLIDKVKDRHRRIEDAFTADHVV